ncbi:MAG: hypothetical protein HY078_13025 [Elusimicrobia bacterium]|nr:hypothetical protein [Elusimicrobiota bacterium]
MSQSAARRSPTAGSRLRSLAGAVALAVTGAVAAYRIKPAPKSSALRPLFPSKIEEKAATDALKDAAAARKSSAGPAFQAAAQTSSLDFLIGKQDKITPEAIKAFLAARGGSLDFLRSGGSPLGGGNSSASGLPVSLPPEIERAIADDLRSPDVGGGVPANQVRPLSRR